MLRKEEKLEIARGKKELEEIAALEYFGKPTITSKASVEALWGLLLGLSGYFYRPFGCLWVPCECLEKSVWDLLGLVGSLSILLGNLVLIR